MLSVQSERTTYTLKEKHTFEHLLKSALINTLLVQMKSSKLFIIVSWMTGNHFPYPMNVLNKAVKGNCYIYTYIPVQFPHAFMPISVDKDKRPAPCALYE